MIAHVSSSPAVIERNANGLPGASLPSAATGVAGAPIVTSVPASRVAMAAAAMVRTDSRRGARMPASALDTDQGPTLPITCEARNAAPGVPSRS